MVDSHSTPARTRPSVVTISSYLLILFAAIQVISLIVSLSTIGETRDALNDAFADTANAQNVGDFAVFFTIGVGIFTLVLAVGLIVLALMNNRGKNGSRITTWVLGGILLCCTGGGLVSNATGGFTGGSTGGDGPSADEIQRRLDEALPSWYAPVNILLGLLGLLALLTALILLALPKANEFFRKPQQVWEPPTPGAAYPAAPGYPQPGYPQPGYPATGYPAAGHPQPGHPGAPDQPAPPQQSEWQAPQAPSTPHSAPPHTPPHTAGPDTPPSSGGADGPSSSGGSGSSSSGGSDSSSSSGGGSD